MKGASGGRDVRALDGASGGQGWEVSGWMNKRSSEVCIGSRERGEVQQRTSNKWIGPCGRGWRATAVKNMGEEVQIINEVKKHHGSGRWWRGPSGKSCDGEEEVVEGWQVASGERHHGRV